MAHNELYGTEIQTGVIFMVSRDLQFQEFVFEGDEFAKHMENWINRVSTFYETHET